MRDNKNVIRVLVYSYYTTITGWGVLLTQNTLADRGLNDKTGVLESLLDKIYNYTRTISRNMGSVFGHLNPNLTPQNLEPKPRP